MHVCKIYIVFPYFYDKSFKKKDCFIAGQYPVPGAAVDLIRLLEDHGCSTLVSTTPLADIPSVSQSPTQRLLSYKLLYDILSHEALFVQIER